MYSVVETPVYSAKAERILSNDERESIAIFIAQNPYAGSVVQGFGGVRKLRWTRKGKGKRGGARVIYYNRLFKGEIWLLTFYTKSERTIVPAHELKLIKEAIKGD